MKDYIAVRVKEVAEYTVDNKTTVRESAKKFGYSKSTVLKDLQERLITIDPILYKEVKSILEENKATRHIRGGLSTKNKYKGKI